MGIRIFVAAWLVASIGASSLTSPFASLLDTVDQMLITKPGLKHAHRALEFDDFAEIPDECPATTTCPVVCVADLAECPTACEPGLSLCATGNCLVDCSGHNASFEEELYSNPCECETLPMACPKVIDLFDSCFTQFQGFYDNSTSCVEAQEESEPRLSFTGPWFLACYIELASVTVLVFLWCLYNQKLAPVATSTVPMQAANNITTGEWTQTGYRTTIIGTILYLLVNVTLFLFQFLLLITTLFYYMQQESVTRWAPVFENEIQVLMAFEIVWMVGIVWSLAFRYPSTGIRALFLRRCDLSQATHVAIVAPIKTIEVAKVPSAVSRLSAAMWFPIDCIFRTIFSHPYDKWDGMETTFCPVECDRSTGTRSILHRMRRYVYSSMGDGGRYIPGVMSVGTTIGDLIDQSEGLSIETASERRGLAGPNVIPLVKPTILSSVYNEFAKTFYVYQLYMCWTWFNFFYYDMAMVNTSVRILGGLVVAYFQYTSDCILHQLSFVDGDIDVLRSGTFQTFPVKEVVPGDVVAIKAGRVHCDMVILKGFGILMDESALTGESTPVQKMELDPVSRKLDYNPTLHKSSTISAGTEVLEVDSNGSNLGLVIKTGSFTAKGELLTEVLSYQRHRFRFDDEVILVLCILVVEAIVLVTLAFLFLNDNWVFSWFYGAFILGTVIPPLLPTVFVVSVGISANRLQSKRITCTYPGGILIAGKVDTAFFDKTGTLTKQGMDFISCDCDESMNERVKLGMAVCHTLTTTNSGEVVGHQVDKVSFESTGATLVSNKGDLPRVLMGGKEYTVLKQFEFDCRRAAQSVVVQSPEGETLVVVKGSPEVIKGMSVPSTLPDFFDTIVQESSKSGVYQIAIAFRKFDLDQTVSEAHRDDLETSLTFGAFINFQNLLREETAGVLQELVEGDVSTAMITGDSALTGICIARECGMIEPNRTVLLGRVASDAEVEWIDFDSDAIAKRPVLSELDTADLAITGAAWTLLSESDPKYATMLSKHIKVFGRCKPEDKAAIVASFVVNGHKTLMCGDGQNDCGSLKTAHVGIALSSAEASVVAPFTSLDKTLTSVSEVLREGRCALASALAAYSYYIIYGQTESFLQVINAYLSITFTEWCWVFLDGIWSISMAFTLPLSKAANKLTPRRPTDSLLGSETMLSVCGILALNFLYLVLALFILFQQDWFQCRKWNSDDVSNVLAIGDNYESTVIFVIGGYQYICSAMVLNFGYTFRQSWYRNYLFVFLSLTWTAFFFVMTTYPSSFSCIWRVNCDNENAVRWVTTPYPVAIINPFNTTVMPVFFRWILVAIMVSNAFTIMVWQYFIVNGLVAKKEQGTGSKE